MKKNKGAVGIILAIIIGVIIIALGAYLMGKNNFQKEKFVNSNNQTDNSSACTPNSPASIKILSPNGGEIYKIGDEILIKWQTCNINNARIFAELYGPDSKNWSNLTDDIDKGLDDDGEENVIIHNLIKEGEYFLRITANNSEVGQAAKDESDNKFTINSSTASTADWETYADEDLGVEFRYPSTASVTKQKLGRTDLESGDVITISLPFINHYDSWTSKKVNIIAHDGSCSDYLPTSPTQKKIINGTSYIFEDPEWTATSGMSTISKWRKYYYESTSKCYSIEERLSGLGNNERPSTATFPSDVNKFLETELIDLDKIVSTITIKPSQILTTLPKYIRSAFNSWPPVIKHSSDKYLCTLSHTQNQDVIERIINDRKYCITDYYEGAAGTIYHTYTYVTSSTSGSGTETTNFTVGYGCGGYGGPGDEQYDQCNLNETTFKNNLDQIIDTLISK